MTYWRWDSVGGDTLLRETDGSVHQLTGAGWVDAGPAAMDAIVGMGPDPWSCGEHADAITEGEAVELAASLGLPSPTA